MEVSTDFEQVCVCVGVCGVVCGRESETPGEKQRDRESGNLI